MSLEKNGIFIINTFFFATVFKEKMIENTATNISYKSTKILLCLGVTPNNIAYSYISYAMRIAENNSLSFTKVTRDLYPSIANYFNTTSSSVESAIRHAIDMIWSRNSIERINKVFGLTVYTSTYDKPGNGEFLSILFETVRLDIANFNAFCFN